MIQPWRGGFVIVCIVIVRLTLRFACCWVNEQTEGILTGRGEGGEVRLKEDLSIEGLWQSRGPTQVFLVFETTPKLESRCRLGPRGVC